MLKIKPSCENCDKPLPNGSPDAMICSYECTFCVGCVEGPLDSVCPNCGGGFVPRPARVKQEWRAGVSAEYQLPSTDRVYKPINTKTHRAFAAKVKQTALTER